MCSLVSHDKKQPAYEDGEISLVDRLVTKNATTESLESLVADLNFTDIWLKLLEENYEMRSGIYNKAMKEVFKTKPITMIKALSPKQKN